MLNIKELKKIFKYNYKNFFINMYPRDNKRIISENTFNNIITSGILLLIGYALLILVLLKVVPLAANMKVNYFGIGIGIFQYLVLFYPVLVIAYTIINRYKEETGKNYFIILIIGLILGVFLLFRTITFIGVLGINLLLGLLGFVSLIISLVGYGFLFVGIIDHLIFLKRDYLTLTTTIKKVEIKTSTIDVDDVSMH